MLAYVGAGIIGLAVLAGIVAVIVSSGGGGGGATADAHIEQGSGSTNGVEPDNRTGTPPPPAKLTNLKVAAKKAECDLRLHLKDEGHTHIAPGSQTPDYKTNPPTSGNHVEPPFQQADGAYAEMPEEIDMVHSLEHGRMEIQYSPDLTEKQQLELKGLYDTMYGGALLLPERQDGLRGGGDDLDQPARLRRIQGLDHRRRDPRLRRGDLGQIRRRAGQRTSASQTGPTPAEPAEPAVAIHRERYAGKNRPVPRPPLQVGVGRRVADDLRGVPRHLAVREAALELLEPVAAGDSPAEVERQAPLGGKLDQGRDDVLHRRVARGSSRSCR